MLSAKLSETLNEEEDELEGFELWLVEIAHDEGYLLEEYPIVVLGLLFDMAVADEQYERAGQIKNLIKLKLNSGDLKQ